jgi:predicted 3-demethylubiquinone-9 3-methyltransferase (glyoxalase superfamily)
MNRWVTIRTEPKPAAFALIEPKEHTKMKPKNTICLWFDKDAHEAAQFYAATFPDSTSWQITPRALTDALAAGGGEAKRAFEAMMPMQKIDIAAIEAARRG